MSHKPDKMTKGNALTFTLSKVRKATNTNDETSTKNARDVMLEYDPGQRHCSECPGDDFGYCGILDSDIGETRRLKEYIASRHS